MERIILHLRQWTCGAAPSLGRRSYGTARRRKRGSARRLVPPICTCSMGRRMAAGLADIQGVSDPMTIRGFQSEGITPDLPVSRKFECGLKHANRIRRPALISRSNVSRGHDNEVKPNSRTKARSSRRRCRSIALEFDFYRLLDSVELSAQATRVPGW